MQSFWNSPLAVEIKGLDVLGVRGHDQAIEAQLVNGITTVSIRARYYSILTWAVGAYLKRNLDDGEKGHFSNSSFQVFLRRVEFLTLACTNADANDYGQLTGVLGTELFADEIAQLVAKGTAQVPDVRSAILLTYYGPCRAIGLLRDQPGSVLPCALTELGRKILDTRELGIKETVLDFLMGGGALTIPVRDEGKQWFSLHAQTMPASERALLLEAFRTPREGASDENHQKFLESVSWILDELKGDATTAEWLLARNYASKVESGPDDDVSDIWAEYEWQRRCHFAFEWLLAILSGALNSHGDSSVGQVVDRLMADANLRLDGGSSLLLIEIASTMTIGTLKTIIPANYLLDQPLPTRSLSAMRGGTAALSVATLLVALVSQSESLRIQGVFSRIGFCCQSAVRIIEEADDRTIAQTLKELLIACAVVPHLRTTLRKMGSGQGCSLRFFPDGDILRSTAVPMAPGRSATRMVNLLGILRDLSVLEATEDGYAPGIVVFE